MRVVLSETGTTGLIRDWAYDNSGSEINISAVPEIFHATLPLICIGSLLVGRRRKQELH